MHDRCSLCGVNELLPTAACCGVRGILQSYRTYFRDITLLLLALSKQKLSLLEVGGVLPFVKMAHVSTFKTLT